MLCEEEEEKKKKARGVGRGIVFCFCFALSKNLGALAKLFGSTPSGLINRVVLLSESRIYLGSP